MNKVEKSGKKLLLAGICLVTGLMPWTPSLAAEFSLYLRCEGKVLAGGKSTASHADFALRDNNNTALIQRSNALPVGERLKYVVSPMTYSMNYQARGTNPVIMQDWMRGQIFVWQPSLKRVATVRISIDRQTGALSGEMLNADADVLGQLRMQCEAMQEEDLPPPKF